MNHLARFSQVMKYVSRRVVSAYPKKCINFGNVERLAWNKYLLTGYWRKWEKNHEKGVRILD